MFLLFCIETFYANLNFAPASAVVMLVPLICCSVFCFRCCACVQVMLIASKGRDEVFLFLFSIGLLTAFMLTLD